MHSDLNNTTLRGYVQIETANNYGVSKHIPLYYPNGTNITNSTGGQVYAVDYPHYLGPTIIAQKDWPVRVKFTNYLATGADGNLFIPVDTTVMGSGEGPNATKATNCSMIPTDPTCYAQNRATVHLHGGNTPWISDGTNPRGVSVGYVPDQWYNSSKNYTPIPSCSMNTTCNVPGATNNPGDGSLTFYYTNQQSARLMFYHNHAYGITRLNVYAGEAAGYLVTDTAEQTLMNGGNLTTIDGTNLTVSPGTIPVDEIPLVIQDKAFLPDQATLAAQDPTWPFEYNASFSNLWYPHVYMPNQNPYDISGANPMGRWDYGPWFLPNPMTAASGLRHGPVSNPLYGNLSIPWYASEGPENPGTPNITLVPEAFVDTPIVNGNAYPFTNIGQKAYRLRILNAANDRYFNLQLYYASTAGPFVVFNSTDGNGEGATAIVTVNATGSITGITLLDGGAGYTYAPAVNITGGGGSGATATVSLANITMELQPKAIQELFEFDYGRMNAILGMELINANANTQTTIPYGFTDSPTEVINNSISGVALGTLGDGTQIWRLTHNGVDSHAVHWHMFNLQVINRVGWDGAVHPIDPNELGWKETIRVNPLEDTIVALRPITPKIPWDLPNSIRPLDVTSKLGTTGQFGSTTGWNAVDPLNNPVNVINHLVNFGWEYVWHCHLLGHEENDMMRPMIVAVNPQAPINLNVTLTGTKAKPSITLNWTDNSTNEYNWTVQRATSASGPWTNIATWLSTTGPAIGGTPITYIDATVVKTTTYYYRVIANNVVGDTTVYPAPAVGYPHVSADSLPSNTANRTTG
jgi:FtsP/CotA-like multicopper oxidase with cupredoxin domain